MKAFLLAAGLGTRLRPLTDTVPKCLVPIAGRPLLDIWLEQLDRSGVDDVLVNLHHLAPTVERFLDGRRAPPRVHRSFEASLLGSAGTLRANRDWVSGEAAFLACNADNLTDVPLDDLVTAHLGAGAPATVGVFEAPDPSRCGVVEVDGTGTMVGFEEKPRRPRSHLANAGIYVFSPSVLDEIPAQGVRDIGHHLLPRLVGRARAVSITGYFRDIGSPEAYQAAQHEWVGATR